MSSLARLVNRIRASNTFKATPSLALKKRSFFSADYTRSILEEDKHIENKPESAEVDGDDFITSKKGLDIQGVDPKRGWDFRGVHKAIICGKIGQTPVQKILRNGKTVTIFTIGTGGMFDQRIVDKDSLPKPAQWHRIAVHNEYLGAYAVQQLVKGSSVYVEGDIETRVYNDSINGQVKNIPEICVRRDGKVSLIKTGERVNSISLGRFKRWIILIT